MRVWWSWLLMAPIPSLVLGERLLSHVIGPVTRQEGRYPVMSFRLFGVEIAKKYIRTQLSVEETLQLIINALDTEDYRALTALNHAKSKTLAIRIKDQAPGDPPKQRMVSLDSARQTYARNFCAGIIKSLKKGLSRLKFHGTEEEFLKEYEVEYPSPIWNLTKHELTLFNDPSIFWQFYDFIIHVTDSENQQLQPQPEQPQPQPEQSQPQQQPTQVSSVSLSEFPGDEYSISVNYSDVSETHYMASTDKDWLFVSFQDEDHFDRYYL